MFPGSQFAHLYNAGGEEGRASQATLACSLAQLLCTEWAVGVKAHGRSLASLGTRQGCNGHQGLGAGQLCLDSPVAAAGCKVSVHLSSVVGLQPFLYAPSVCTTVWCRQRSGPFLPASVGAAWLHPPSPSPPLSFSWEQAGEGLKRACMHHSSTAVTEMLIKGSSTKVLFCFVFNSIFFLFLPYFFNLCFQRKALCTLSPLVSNALCAPTELWL